MSDSVQPHGLQHSRLPCPSPTPGAYSSPLSQWCYPTISVLPFSSCLQSFLASGSFPMSQLLAWGGQSIGVSSSASVLPMNTQDWSPLGWTGWISLQSKGLKSLLQYHSSKAPILQLSAFFIVQLSHPYMTTGKTIPLTRWTFVSEVMSLLFNIFFNLISLFSAVLGHCCCSWAFSSYIEGGLLSSCSVTASHCGGLSCCRAWARGILDLVVVKGLICSLACGLLPDQG